MFTIHNDFAGKPTKKKLLEQNLRYKFQKGVLCFLESKQKKRAYTSQFDSTPVKAKLVSGPLSCLC